MAETTHWLVRNSLSGNLLFKPVTVIGEDSVYYKIMEGSVIHRNLINKSENIIFADFDAARSKALHLASGNIEAARKTYEAAKRQLHEIARITDRQKDTL